MNRPAPSGMILLLLFLSAASLYGQDLTVEGRIRDAETGLSVPLVTVYLNGTSIGAISGPDGKFRISHAVVPCELILSHVSYQPVNLPLRDSSRLTGLELSMEKRVTTLEEVTVYQTTPEEKEFVLERFKKWFLGRDYEETGAEILNDSVLRFKLEEHLQFSAMAVAPIRVKLPATGYLLTVDLVHFYLDYREQSGDYHCSVLGYYYFEPMDTRTRREERWRSRERANAYYNSPRHFCKSLYHNQLLQNGYRFARIGAAEATDRLATDGRDGGGKVPDFVASYESDDFGNQRLMLTRFASPDFGIRYSYRAGNKPADLTYLQSNPQRVRFSGLTFIKDTVYIYPSGRLPGNSILFSGSIGEKGAAYMLPEDYIPSMQ